MEEEMVGKAVQKALLENTTAFGYKADEWLFLLRDGLDNEPREVQRKAYAALLDTPEVQRVLWAVGWQGLHNLLPRKS